MNAEVKANARAAKNAAASAFIIQPPAF